MPQCSHKNSESDKSGLECSDENNSGRVDGEGVACHDRVFHRQRHARHSAVDSPVLRRRVLISPRNSWWGYGKPADGKEEMFELPKQRSRAWHFVCLDREKTVMLFAYGRRAVMVLRDFTPPPSFRRGTSQGIHEPNTPAFPRPPPLSRKSPPTIVDFLNFNTAPIVVGASSSSAPPLSTQESERSPPEVGRSRSCSGPL